MKVKSNLQYFWPALSDNRSSETSLVFLRMAVIHRFQGSTSFVGLLCFFSVMCLLCLCVHLFICALWSPVGKGLNSWLSFVVSNCEFVTFPLVYGVRCGTWLYRFLIFTYFTVGSAEMVFITLAIHYSASMVSVFVDIMCMLQQWSCRYTLQSWLLFWAFSDCLCLKYHLDMGLLKGLNPLMHISLASFLSDIAKQCKTRTGATKCGVWSGSPLFA